MEATTAAAAGLAVAAVARVASATGAAEWAMVARYQSCAAPVGWVAVPAAKCDRNAQR